jgi:hypothetical protein
LQGIKIHFREFLYDFALKRNKLLSVKVKSKPSQEDGDDHVKRLELLRGWADRRQEISGGGNQS